MNNKELYHFGVSGMKWGVRRAGKKSTVSSNYKKAGLKYKLNNNPNDKLREVGGPQKRSTSKKSNKNNAENIKKMSDQELRTRLNRINMEQQYSNLTRKSSSAGKKWVTGIIIGSATGLASGYTSRYMDKGLKFVGNQIVNATKRAIR